MIEILKPGQTKFTATCNNCGCEFTYELEDVDIDKSVLCPCCKNKIYHEGKPNYPYWPNGIRGIPSTIEITPLKSTELTSAGDPCENCDWHKKMLTSKEPYIGDSPCQWCQHYPYKITCVSTNQCK